MQQKVSNPHFALTNLSQLVELCILLETTNQSLREASNEKQHPSTPHTPSQKSGYNQPSTREHRKPSTPSTNTTPKKKTCTHHPDSFSHWTSECKFGASSSPRPPLTPPSAPSSSSSTPAGTATSSLANVTCYGCNQKGHTRNHPSCPKYAENHKKPNTSPPPGGSKPSPSSNNPPGSSMVRTVLDRTLPESVFQPFL